jgi:hypothetical protein
MKPPSLHSKTVAYFVYFPALSFRPMANNNIGKELGCESMDTDTEQAFGSEQNYDIFVLKNLTHLRL